MNGAKVIAVLICVALIAAALWFVDDFIAPLLLNSRIERLAENNLPTVVVENGSTLYFRMKADDFRFPLPPGTCASNAVVTGGIDTIDGSVEARFVGTNQVTASQYEGWLVGKVKSGGSVKATATSGGLLIKFSYFGDK